MDLGIAKKFGRGPRELGGAIDLISHYKLWPHHDFFCKKSLPLSISGTQYLRNVVGETEIKKGEGMELDQLFQKSSSAENRNPHIQPFELGVLREAFHMKETTPIDLLHGENGKHGEAKNMKKHKKNRKEDKAKDKHNNKQKRRHKDANIAKDMGQMGNGFHEFGPDYVQKHQDKKKRIDGSADLSVQRYQQSGVTSAKQNSRINESGKLRIGR